MCATRLCPVCMNLYLLLISNSIEKGWYHEVSPVHYFNIHLYADTG